MKTASRLLIPLGLLIGACSTGIEVADFKPAQGPEGVRMEIKLNGDVIEGGKVAGELLAVRADGVLLNVVGYRDNAKDVSRVVLVPYWMMNTARLEQMGRARVESQGEEMNEVHLNRLRLVSRFPQGLSDELLTELMNSLGQEKLEVPQRLE
jgi:hypothetical protein